MPLNKVNLCWVLSEGQKGHEIQSMTLAQSLAINTSLIKFNLLQPWETLAPRVMPGFQYGYQWQSQKPDFNHPPQLIISTGRKAAAVGKYIAQRYRKAAIELKHIQILNPKDRANKYDMLLIPEHDQITGPNIITFTGSIHPFSPHWFETTEKTATQKQTIAVIIGNPANDYLHQGLPMELEKIRQLYPAQTISVCGSPRLNPTALNRIKTLLKTDDTYWFNQQDGANPYQALLKQAKHLFVTADSINMMNECASSPVRVSLLAQKYVRNPKHLRYIQSLSHRWYDLAGDKELSIQPIPYALDQIRNNDRFQKLMNSPNSSNAG